LTRNIRDNWKETDKNGKKKEGKEEEEEKLTEERSMNGTKKTN